MSLTWNTWLNERDAAPLEQLADWLAGKEPAPRQVCDVDAVKTTPPRRTSRTARKRKLGLSAVEGLSCWGHDDDDIFVPPELPACTRVHEAARDVLLRSSDSRGAHEGDFLRALSVFCRRLEADLPGDLDAELGGNAPLPPCRCGGAEEAAAAAAAAAGTGAEVTTLVDVDLADIPPWPPAVGAVAAAAAMVATPLRSWEDNLAAVSAEALCAEAASLDLEAFSEMGESTLVDI